MNKATSRSRELFVSATLVGVAVAGLMVFRGYFQSRLRAQNAELVHQAGQIARLQMENERLSNLVARALNPASPANKPSDELLQLRGEVGVLREQTNQLFRLREEGTRVSQALAESGTNPVSTEDQLTLVESHGIDAMTTLLQAIRKYEADHNGQYPGNLEQLVASGDLEGTNFAGNLRLDDFQFGEAVGLDPRGKPAILSLRLPSPRPGGGSVIIMGGISDDGVPTTTICNAFP